MSKIQIEKLEELYKNTDFNWILEGFEKPVYKKFFLLKSICKWPSFKSFNVFLSSKKLPIEKKVKDWFGVYFKNADVAIAMIEEFVRSEYDRLSQKIIIDSIIAELSKLQCFDWGWIYQNALEWKIVKNVQKTYIYDEIKKSLTWKLFESYLNYWFTSWYSYWSSVIVEHYFKMHKRIMPTVGLVKYIDFLFDDIPMDLKVTYLPQEYIDMRRNESKLDREFKVLKSRMAGIKGMDFSVENLMTINNAINASKNLGLDVFGELKDFRKKISDNLANDLSNEKEKLLSWLYENQWTRRYDNSYRLFLICIDDISIIDAWKMKINKGLQSKINEFLDKWPNLMEVKYQWEGRSKTTKASALIVRKSEL